MKNLTALLFIFTIPLLVFCGRLKGRKKQTASTKEVPVMQNDSQQLKEVWRKREEVERADSIRMANIWEEAMRIANKHLQTNAYKKDVELNADGLYTVKGKLAMNHFFSNSHKHLIVHLSQPWTEDVDVNYEYISIYLKEGNSFKNVVSYRQWATTYVSDTLQDVNGDGANDFLINWYGSNGCCLKIFYDVYLYQPQTGKFSEGYEFINPTFSSKEKVIRGVEYGHPGDTRMYKFKWNGLQVDTLEYISFERDNNGKNTGKIIRDIVLNNNVETLKSYTLKKVPSEYKHIYGYDWFTGEFDKFQR